MSYRELIRRLRRKEQYLDIHEKLHSQYIANGALVVIFYIGYHPYTGAEGGACL